MSEHDIDLDAMRRKRSSTPDRKRKRCANLECLSVKIRRTGGGYYGPPTEYDYRCTMCDEEFDEPVQIDIGLSEGIEVDTGEEELDEGRCFCAGDHPEWQYHHSSGCAETAQAFGLASDVRPHEAWTEPRSRDDSGEER